MLRPNQKHPHACGEDSFVMMLEVKTVETPPRMWGRHMAQVAKVSHKGNTPTHVGKTPGYGVQPLQNEKHPHACGEDSADLHSPDGLPETPPRMWGRHGCNRLRSKLGRNTPTHVGKTRFCQCNKIGNRKHPHACGEDIK